MAYQVMVYTDAMDESIRGWRAEGVSYSQIAAKLGTTKGSVVCRGKRLGLIAGYVRPELKASMRDVFNIAKSQSAIRDVPITLPVLKFMTRPMPDDPKEKRK